MPRLSTEQWVVLKAEWINTPISTNAIAKKFGVNEKSVRERAQKENWEKAPSARKEKPIPAPHLEAATAAAFLRHEAREQRKAPKARIPEPSPEPTPEPREPVAQGPEKPASSEPRTALGRYRPEEIPTLSPEALAEVRQEVVDRLATIWELATIQDLDRVDKQAGLFARLHELLMAALGPSDGTEESDRRRAEAIGRLIVGRTDSIGGMIQALAKLGNDIQAQRRRAMGLDDRPVRIQHSGPGGGPIPMSSAPQAAVPAVTLDQLQSLPTEKLRALYDAAQILEGQQERPPVPMPPGEVVTVNPETGQPEEEARCP